VSKINNRSGNAHNAQRSGAKNSGEARKWKSLCGPPLRKKHDHEGCTARGVGSSVSEAVTNINVDARLVPEHGSGGENKGKASWEGKSRKGR